MILLATDFSAIAVKAGQFILSFSILIVLHEFGHFITAKWFGCRVEKFYLFFNPWFSLFKKKKGETEYGLGWIPLGGYVKISGMIDESMDKEAMKKPPEPYEFRSKPAWQRLIIMLGGIIVNVILAILIFIMVLWVWGKEYLPPANAKYGIATDSLARTVGLKDGDIVWKVDTASVKDFNLVRGLIVLNEAKTLTVERGDSVFTLPLDAGLVKKLNTRSAGNFVGVRFPFEIKEFSEKSNAEKAGLQAGDRIIGVNDSVTLFYNDFIRQIKGKKNQSVQLKAIRGNDTLLKTVQVDAKGLIGVKGKNLDDLGFEYYHQKFSFLQSIPAGINECFETLGKYVIGLRQLFTGKANPNESLGSVFSIGSIYSSTWDWHSFWTLTAVFSIILAFMNVLPIPALDGGHALFTFYEMVTGHKPSDKFMEIAQMVGMVLLLGLMAYALGLDISRWFK